VTLKTVLKNRLRNAKKVAILGVGSELRGDDAAGIFVARQIDKGRLNMKKQGKLKVFAGATAPENLTGEVKRFNPTHLIIVDSADMNEKPGVVKLINPDTISGFSSCTHSLPIKILSDYLVKSIGCKITIIAIQPKTLDFGSCLSNKVERSAADISQIIKIILMSNYKTDA